MSKRSEEAVNEIKAAIRKTKQDLFDAALGDSLNDLFAARSAYRAAVKAEEDWKEVNKSILAWAGKGDQYGWRIYCSAEGPWAMFCGSGRTASRYGSWRKVKLSEAPLAVQQAWVKR